MNDCLACGLRPIADTYGAHERVEDADGERGSAREWLRHVQLGVGIVVVVLVQKLHVRVVTCQSRHAHLQSRDLAREPITFASLPANPSTRTWYSRTGFKKR